jgi:hypothetical protein
VKKEKKSWENLVCLAAGRTCCKYMASQGKSRHTNWLPLRLRLRDSRNLLYIDFGSAPEGVRAWEFAFSFLYRFKFLHIPKEAWKTLDFGALSV